MCVHVRVLLCGCEAVWVGMHVCGCVGVCRPELEHFFLAILPPPPPFPPPSPHNPFTLRENQDNPKEMTGWSQEHFARCFASFFSSLFQLFTIFFPGCYWFLFIGYSFLQLFTLFTFVMKPHDWPVTSVPATSEIRVQ